LGGGQGHKNLLGVTAVVQRGTEGGHVVSLPSRYTFIARERTSPEVTELGKS